MSNATALLALPAFSVEHVFEFVDEAIVVIELPRAPLACPRCGGIGLHRVHDRAVHRVRDLPAARRAVVLVWHKRGRDEAVRQVAADNLSVAAVARSSGVAPSATAVPAQGGSPPRRPALSLSGHPREWAMARDRARELGLTTRLPQD